MDGATQEAGSTSQYTLADTYSRVYSNVIDPGYHYMINSSSIPFYGIGRGDITLLTDGQLFQV